MKVCLIAWGLLYFTSGLSSSLRINKKQFWKVIEVIHLPWIRDILSMSNCGRLLSCFDLLLEPETVQEQRSSTVNRPTASILAAFFSALAPAAFDFRWCGMVVSSFSVFSSMIEAWLLSGLLLMEHCSTGLGWGVPVVNKFFLEDIGVDMMEGNDCYKRQNSSQTWFKCCYTSGKVKLDQPQWYQ